MKGIPLHPTGWFIDGLFMNNDEASAYFKAQARVKELERQRLQGVKRVERYRLHLHKATKGGR